MDRQNNPELPSNASASSKRQNDTSPEPEAKRIRLNAYAEDDINFSLRRIRDDCRISIMEMMKDIQTTQTKRDETSDFVSRLKCLRLISVNDTINFETALINDFGEDCAIASWSFTPSVYENVTAGICRIREGSTSRSSKVRNPVWRRAVAYMEHKSVRVKHLWIDAECIAKEDSKEKEKAMSEMDLLYHHGSHPFGMLTRPIENETELHLLAQILQGQMSCQPGHKKEYPLRTGVAMTSAREAIQLLEKILDDRWWERAWIYQENYHGGERMHLLMPHDSKLTDSKAKYGRLFGDLEGELIISSIQFCKALTEICSAFITWSTEGDDQQKVAHQILSRAGRYSTLLEERHSMSPNIIADVGGRDVGRHPDRLPIIANCCSYNVRLKNNMLAEKGHSVSLAILVSFILNGEIFRVTQDEKPEDAISSSDLTVVKFIQKYAFDGFSPPSPRYGLTFNKSCRFVEPSLEDDGVHTKGHIWKLFKQAIKVPYYQSEKWDTAKKALWVLHDCIMAPPRRVGLARRLEDFLKKSPQSPADDYMWNMAEKIAEAMREGKKLRLGYDFCISETDYSPPMAIFICPDETMKKNKDSVLVLTSFKARNASDKSAYNSDIDKHVSLQVDVDRSMSRPKKLYAREWMHGLVFLSPGKRPKPVVFPLPRILGDL